jgi:hypothetical protein
LNVLPFIPPNCALPTPREAERDQFAHPAAALVLSADRQVARALSGLGINGNNLRLALVETGRGALVRQAIRQRFQWRSLSRPSH